MIQKLMLSALLLGAGSVNAQTKTFKLLHLTSQQQKHLQLVNSLIQKNPHGPVAHKPTAVKQRVVAQVYTEEGESDSLRYHYTGSNGSSYNYNNFVDIGYSYSFWPDISPAYGSFDGYLPSTDVKADSISSFAEGALYARNIAYYNSAGLLDSAMEKEFPSGDLNEKILVQRNAAGLVTTFDRLNLAGPVGAGQRRRISHNTSGQVLVDTIYNLLGGTWDYSNSRTYHYNSSNQLDTMLESMGEIYETKYVFSYDAADRLITTKAYSIMEDSPAILESMDTIGYTSGHDYITFYQNTYYGESGMNGGFRYVQYPGSHPGPDSVTLQFSEDDDDWNTLATLMYTYNSQGNPIVLTGESENPEDGDIMIQFYYEDYDDGLSNEDVFLSKDFTVYPNPFTNNISLEYKGKEQKNVSVSLADITGRSVFQSSINLQSGSNNISLPALSTGTYILQVVGKSGKLYTNKLVKK